MAAFSETGLPSVSASWRRRSRIWSQYSELSVFAQFKLRDGLEKVLQKLRTGHPIKVIERLGEQLEERVLGRRAGPRRVSGGSHGFPYPINPAYPNGDLG